MTLKLTNFVADMITVYPYATRVLFFLTNVKCPDIHKYPDLPEAFGMLPNLTKRAISQGLHLHVLWVNVANIRL